MKIKGIRALVLGAGVSGRSAARFLAQKGARVVVADDAVALPPELGSLEALGVAFVAGGLEKAGLEFELAVLSPGISAFDERVRALIAAGVETIGEVELASRFISAPIIGITGTNGKTTVTHLVERQLKAAGKKVFAGGNVGTPLVEAVGGDWEVVVAEISSFQLELAPTFRPKVAVWLNLTGDHLDRHGDLEGYAEAKAALLVNQRASDFAVLNRDDPLVWSFAKKTSGCVLPFSLEGALGVGGWQEGEEAVVLMPGTDGVRIPLSPMKLGGAFNRANALAATLAVTALGVSPGEAWEAARTFEGLAHRNEEFLQWRGIHFVDDSKATNVDAAVKAVHAAAGRVVWLGGGVDKGAQYEPLKEALSRKARLVVAVGEGAARMARELEGAAPMRRPAVWPAAVKIAIGEAERGDTVLLSPAAASFDFFKSYSERGEIFQLLCREETARVDGEGSAMTQTER